MWVIRLSWDPSSSPVSMFRGRALEKARIRLALTPTSLAGEEHIQAESSLSQGCWFWADSAFLMPSCGWRKGSIQGLRKDTRCIFFYGSQRTILMWTKSSDCRPWNKMMGSYTLSGVFQFVGFWSLKISVTLSERQRYVISPCGKESQ